MYYGFRRFTLCLHLVILVSRMTILLCRGTGYDVLPSLDVHMPSGASYPTPALYVPGYVPLHLRRFFVAERWR